MNYSKFLKPIYLYGNKEQDQGAEGRELEKGIVFNEAILFRFARQRVETPFSAHQRCYCWGAQYRSRPE